MGQIGGYPVYPGGNSTNIPWYSHTTLGGEPAYFWNNTAYDKQAWETLQSTLNERGKQIVEKSNKEKEPMIKYYKVLQDTPDFVEGAILFLAESNAYKAQYDVFFTDAAEQAASAGYGPLVRPKVVENSPTWFERVYALGFDEDEEPRGFGTKAEAQAAVNGTGASTSTSA